MAKTTVKRILFALALLILFAVEIFRVYFIMPLPGSQVSDTISYAYWLDRSIVWVRILVLLLSCLALSAVFKRGKIWEMIVLPVALLAYGGVFFAFNFRFPAD